MNLRKLRAQKKLSQESLAALADINRNYVGMLEREQFSATIDIIEKLADALDVEPTTLLTRGSSS
ncbi:helix-turn-helix domain-containing protein [Methylorubrum salsuginis]|uniref:helix-turn-helix domain-containing protein n=1 Tax=Methylorubrum salsuginis TaxID=414703 RepID=UPI000B028AC7|nr:helix-turn-helix transcriptional regulator [Methylorubrum salsuginis]